MSDPRLDPALGKALDAYTVPPLSPGFADRVVAAAANVRPSLPAPVPSRGGRRARWIRGHRVVIGVVAFGLMSAGAAATAIFGDVARTIPVIGPLIASVSPEKPQHKSSLAHVAKPKTDEGTVPAMVEEVAPAPLPLTLPEQIAVRRAVRREIVAERIAAGLQQRAERRESLGLPPRPPHPAQIMPILRRIPPADRAAVVQRVREIRLQQRAAELGLTERAPVPPEPNAAIAPRPDQQLPPSIVPSLPVTPSTGAPSPGTEPVVPTSPAAGAVPRGEVVLTPERIEQLRRLRAYRELQQRRRELRRQRLQQ